MIDDFPRHLLLLPQRLRRVSRGSQLRAEPRPLLLGVLELTDHGLERRRLRPLRPQLGHLTKQSLLLLHRERLVVHPRFGARDLRLHRGCRVEAHDASRVPDLLVHRVELVEPRPRGLAFRGRRLDRRRRLPRAFPRLCEVRPGRVPGLVGIAHPRVQGGDLRLQGGDSRRRRRLPGGLGDAVVLGGLRDLDDPQLALGERSERNFRGGASCCSGTKPARLTGSWGGGFGVGLVEALRWLRWRVR